MTEPTTIGEIHRRSPSFFKPGQQRLLIVGAGPEERDTLYVLLQNSAYYTVTIVAFDVNEEIRSLSEKYPGITIIESGYDKSLLHDIDLVFVAAKDPVFCEQVTTDAEECGLPVYTAGSPGWDDWVGALPVRHVNAGVSVGEKLPLQSNGEIRWRRIATWCLIPFFILFVAHLVLYYYPLTDIIDSVKDGAAHIDSSFYWMIAAGFLAQMVDGMLGMGYGVVSTTILMSLGVNIAAISSSIHTAEMFSSGASGYSHYKFGNVNKKLFKTLLIPGIAGAVLGAFLLSWFGGRYAEYIRPLIACYTMLLGIRILIISFRKKTKKSRRVRRVGWLAGAGGFLDSFGGGGWGPLVTSTLISKGRSPRYVIGSVSIAEFFVTFASALTFFTMIGVSHWQIIAGLIIGGLVAAPLAARLAGKLPTRVMLLTVGIMVVIWSLRVLLQSAGVF